MASEVLCRVNGQVEDLMTPDPVTVLPDAPVGEVWQRMAERRFRHMLVAGADRRLLGLVTQRDLLAAARSASSVVDFSDQRPVSQFMHKQVDTVRPECCAAEAARHMLRSKRSCLPVVDDARRVVGILTEADYLRLATRGAPACSCGGVDAADE
ncbi:MAG: CBS domain-containing protein [Myxococcales bacterium]|nr:CBS domain-containing protein [Myxococcales bacterium]MDH5305758.1 CBS domain-containing protein [Myxococcales bacterium]MDH5566528.1 CBS domain-containing protein [Myxococcales bacterium]